jgi:hypothetical protein
LNGNPFNFFFNFIDSVLDQDLLCNTGTSFVVDQYSADSINIVTAIINRTTKMYPEDFA